MKFPLLEILPSAPASTSASKTTPPRRRSPNEWSVPRMGWIMRSASIVGYGIGAGLILGGELYTGAERQCREIGMALLGRRRQVDTA